MATVEIDDSKKPDRIKPEFDPRLTDQSHRLGSYFPEYDYAATNYKRRGRMFRNKVTGKIRAEGPKEHFCTRCVNYYDKLAHAGLFPKGPWSMFCYGDASSRTQDYTAKDLDKLGLSDPQDREMFLLSLDPAAWAEYEMGIKLEWYQKEIVHCTSTRKVTRAGRRVGKTLSFCVDVLYSLYTKWGMDQPRYEYLIICPYETQVKRIFDTLEQLIGLSENLQSSIKASRKSPSWEIELHNGSVARGFSAGKQGGARSDKVRSQDADAIGFDEIDYMADEDIEAIIAIVGSKPKVRVWMSSTPTGAKSVFKRVSHDKADMKFKEFWFISAESPRWTNDAENFFRKLFSDGGFSREFYGEFGEPSSGVFRQQDLDACLREYDVESCRPRDGCIYITGVDWNEVTGTHIVTVECDMSKNPRYALVDKKIIRKGDFQHHKAVEEIVKNDLKWNPAYIYVDEGYGSVQCEMLMKYDKENPKQGREYAKRLKIVNMRNKIEFIDPRNPGLKVSKEAKPFMIDNLASWVGAGGIILPVSEDTSVQIVEEDIALTNVGLVQQMRDMRVEGVSPAGAPTYSQGYEHTLIALCLACMGFSLNFSELNTRPSDVGVIYKKDAFGTEPKPVGLVSDKKPSLAERTRPSRRYAGQQEVDLEVEYWRAKLPGLGLPTPARGKSFYPSLGRGRTIP